MIVIIQALIIFFTVQQQCSKTLPGRCDRLHYRPLTSQLVSLLWLCFLFVCLFVCLFVLTFCLYVHKYVCCGQNGSLNNRALTWCKYGQLQSAHTCWHSGCWACLCGHDCGHASIINCMFRKNILLKLYIACNSGISAENQGSCEWYSVDMRQENLHSVALVVVGMVVVVPMSEAVEEWTKAKNSLRTISDPFSEYRAERQSHKDTVRS